ncbi:hypothetical protein [Morganella psychrotolerans]|uniref:Uncharacterized protein n=1 Tax=Morganella psychrotolerans TaxID=368603 RepID=A0A1B8HPE7_9GAMM|nr:hypothetical protein [Morganella psychrotolerans]OBU11376.1 hypothetical protein AYY17_01115 [Morganella psychrotolerans]
MSEFTFIHMDISEFPVVTMLAFPENMAQTEQWVKELDVLLGKQTAFSLIYPPKDAPEKPDTQEDMDARKYVRRWLKTGKDKMAEYCRAMILTVNQDVQDKAALEQFAPMASAIYGVPVVVADDLNTAREKAAELNG